MKGYKVFSSDWKCGDFQYEVGKTYEMEELPIICERGFHFCEKLVDCFRYQGFVINNKVAEVEALGEINVGKDDSKYCTNKIYIVREMTWEEVLEMVNIGQGCTGFKNSGHYNSGNYNSGKHNSGDCNNGKHNSGSWNIGHWNSGHCNSGNNNSGHCNGGCRNSGNDNSGNYNSGNENIGHCNSGHCNSGNYNSGDWNSGHYNSGDRNSGRHNSGSWNIGHWNSGDWNSGNWNSGDCNIGNNNSGDWNMASFSNGCFNTDNTKIFLFDKLSDWTLDDWRTSKARRIMLFCKNEENRQNWWDNLSTEDKNIIKNIPNFDKEIFKEITGIEVGRNKNGRI